MIDSCYVCGTINSGFFSVAHDRFDIHPGREYEIRCCNSCGLGWTLPEIPAEELHLYYPPSYLGETRKLLAEVESGRWHGTASWRMEDEKARLLSRYCREGAILDVGCGEGKFLWALDPSRWRRVGIEFSHETVAVVRGRIQGVDLIEGTLESAALPERSFDVVTFWHVLEHLKEPRIGLLKAASLLKPGGLVVVSLPNLASHQARWFRSSWFAFGDVPRHVFHFTPKSLALLLEQAGIHPIDKVFFSKAVNFHLWKHSLREWLRERAGTGAPYYVLKPFLHLLPWVERLTGQYGVMTMVGRV